MTEPRDTSDPAERADGADRGDRAAQDVGAERAAQDESGVPTEPRLVGGRYRLGPVIGRGGMATIHRATDLRLDRAVAVKLLLPDVSRDRDLAQRFRREALAATVLRHPNIVACLDTGTDGDQPYLVMELVDGEDLAVRLKRGGRLAPAQVARIGIDIARGLGVAHLRGIVHRDIKPGNVLLAADGRAMVADFGIARLAADAEAALPGTTLGSVHYFSPEQARGRATTPASDVYSLGLLLFEALTGTRAWTGATTDAIALARVGAAAPSPMALVPGVPAALDAVVRRALSPEPGDRFPNGAAMAAALEPIVQALDRPDATTAVHQAPSAVADLPSSRPEPGPAIPGAAASAGVGGPQPVIASLPAGRDRGRPVPSAGGEPGRSRARRRIGPAVAVAVLAIVGGVMGAILVAALPGGDPGATRPETTPLADATAGATRTPRPTPGDTASPAPTPRPTRSAAPSPEPTTVPAGAVADLCEMFFALPCGLGAGRYAPSRFEPAFDIELGDGWSNAGHAADLVTLSRYEGLLTFASRIATVDPDGRATTPRDRARDLIEAIVVTDGISATRPASVRIDGRKGLSVDLAPVVGSRIALFATESTTFYLEPDRTTRVVVVDVRGSAAVLVIEPADGSDLASILETADVAAGSIRWR